MSSSQLGGQILALTGLRYLAAASVVAFHFSKSGNAWVRALVDHCGFGVVIFFVLSGFILVYSYDVGAGKFRGTRPAFWAARVARLYPTYVVGMMLMAPIVIAQSTSASDRASCRSKSILFPSRSSDSVPASTVTRALRRSTTPKSFGVRM